MEEIKDEKLTHEERMTMLRDSVRKIEESNEQSRQFWKEYEQEFGKVPER